MQSKLLKNELKDFWEIDRSHPYCSTEWWTVEAFFETEDRQQWSIRSYLSQWRDKPKKVGSLINITLFNQKNGKCFSYHSRNDTERLSSNKQEFKIEYDESFITGNYPNYVMEFIDKNNNIKLQINFHVKSSPHWITKDATQGWIPLGLGSLRFGFIPKGNIFGTLRIGSSTLALKGKGYFEHVWGNFSFSNPFLNYFKSKKIIPLYCKLFYWWIDSHSLKIPKRISFNTMNNPLGYDWFWAVLDNGWSLVYGNLLFWITQGPAIGTLILSKNEKTSIEFCNIHFKYTKMMHSKNFDFYYPSELELTASKGIENIHIKLQMNAESREYISRFIHNNYWSALVSCEAPGEVKGYYSNGKKKIQISGICKIEPQRQISILGDNSLELNFTLPPKGIGVDTDIASHLLRKRITAKIHLIPRPILKFQIKKHNDDG